MEIMDYRHTEISFQEFHNLINAARKADRNCWYGFIGCVQGRKVMVKGIGTWLQRYAVDSLYQPGPMDISVKEFNAILARPFNN